jgi:hypothetical protein
MKMASEKHRREIVRCFQEIKEKIIIAASPVAVWAVLGQFVHRSTSSAGPLCGIGPNPDDTNSETDIRQWRPFHKCSFRELNTGDDGPRAFC